MRLLIIGSLNGQIGAASKIAISRGAKVSHVTDIGMALAELRSGRGADVALIDVALDIRQLVTSLENERISLPVVACGIGANASQAAGAIRAGDKEYLPLPPEAELIAAVLEAAANEKSAFVWRDPAMAPVVKLADQVAPSSASLLICGETGTGKEVLAKYLHSMSTRKDKAFVSVNCAAIPENLLESELFGHEKGAFTGAVARRVGKFEEADGGTLLLDEISEMDIRLQAKLLRALQEREIDRVGGTKPIRVDIRVIATTNRDLTDEVRKGTFREDLLFRLNVVTLRLPALRDRPDDIQLLSDHFAKRYAESNGVPLRPFAAETVARLRALPWPGNVRELENTIHRAVLLAEGPEISPEAIVLPDGSPRSGRAAQDEHHADQDEAGAARLVGRTVADVERDLIIDTLHHCLGNRTHAANILGISIRTLRNKLKAYSEDGVEVPMPRESQRAIV